MENHKTIESSHQIHPFSPIYTSTSKILILGSFPSVVSRQNNFYYSHPKNRFWPILATIFNEPPLITIEQKITFLKSHNIALWDVLKSCTIIGSSDQSIKDPEVNDIEWLLKQTKITTIFTVGKKAYDLYQKYCYKKTNQEAILLPSTSPANCAIKEKELEKIYQIIKESL